jgi:uncharacterized LabA/DUF88 family protein
LEVAVPESAASKAGHWVAFSKSKFYYSINFYEGGIMNRRKTIVFIDNSNIFQGSQSAGWRIYYKALIGKLEENGEIWQTFFFAAVKDPPRMSQTNFYNILKNDLKFEMTVLPLGRKTVHCRKCGFSESVSTEKGVDVALATKLLILAHNHAFETAIVLSGDKDYLETVKAVKGLGLRVEIVSWHNCLSPDLGAESSSPVIYLDDLRSEIELKIPEPEVDVLMTVD